MRNPITSDIGLHVALDVFMEERERAFKAGGQLPAERWLELEIAYIREWLFAEWLPSNWRVKVLIQADGDADCIYPDEWDW